MKIFKSGKSTVKQPGNSSPSHLTPPLSPPPASPQVSTEWSLGPGETKMAADDGGDGAFVQELNQGMRKDSARTRIGLSVQWFSNLWII